MKMHAPRARLRLRANHRERRNVVLDNVPNAALNVFEPLKAQEAMSKAQREASAPIGGALADGA
jgi:hypothetical protein